MAERIHSPCWVVYGRCHTARPEKLCARPQLGGYFLPISSNPGKRLFCMSLPRLDLSGRSESCDKWDSS